MKYKERERDWNFRKTMQEEAGSLILFTLSFKIKGLDPGRGRTKVSRK